MIKKEDLDALEAKLGLPAGELDKIIKDPAEKEIGIAKFEIIPVADYTTRISNIEKTKYDEGKIAGTETTVKELKRDLGLDVAKTIPVAELATAIKLKVIADAKLPVDEKVRELTKDKETLLGQKTEAENKYNSLVLENKQKDTTQKINNAVIKGLPKFGHKPGELMIPPEDAAELILKRAANAGITPEISDTGEVIFKKGADIIKDANLSPQKAEVVFKDYYQPFVTPAGGGGGGGDNPPGQSKKGGMSAFNKEMDDAGITELSKRNAEMQKRIAAKTLDPNIE